MLECVEAEFVEKRGHGDMRVVRDGVLQCERPMRGQFRDEPIRQRLHAAVFDLIVLGWRTADGDDCPLHRSFGG
jgi:hypothetical protein